MFKQSLLVVAMTILALSNQAFADSSVVGLWSSDSSIFRVYEEEGTLMGQVIALTDPYYLAGEKEGAEGQPRLDDNNPDPEKKGRTIIGLQMFTDYSFTDGRWQGKIYDPESGNTYQSRLKVNRAGELEIRGYIGVPMFGRTATFVPASQCTQPIMAMLELTEHGALCGE